MPETQEAIIGEGFKIELKLTAAMAALASMALIAPETIDISSVVKVMGGGGLTRAVAKDFAFGGQAAVQAYSKHLVQGDITFQCFYTNGQESFGTDTVDLYTFLRELAKYTTTDLPLQFVFSPAGGATGDMQYTSSATKSFITGLTDPIGDAAAAGFIMITFTMSTPDLTEAVVA